MFYSVGFLFSQDQEEVILIKKNHPDWQRGQLNGVGGKVERGETVRACMIREFQEETGIFYSWWRDLVVLNGPDFRVHYYYGLSRHIHNARTMTDEEIGIYKVADLNTLPILPNLRVLIPLALSKFVKPVMLYDSVSDEERLSCFQPQTFDSVLTRIRLSSKCPVCGKPYIDVKEAMIEKEGALYRWLSYNHDGNLCVEEEPWTLKT